PALLNPRPRPRTSALFPYTTLFRSAHKGGDGGGAAQHRIAGVELLGHLFRLDRVLGKTRAAHLLPLGGAVPLAVHTLNIYARLVDRKSTRLNSSHVKISYAVFCLKK